MKCWVYADELYPEYIISTESSFMTKKNNTIEMTEDEYDDFINTQTKYWAWLTTIKERLS